MTKAIGFIKDIQSSDVAGLEFFEACLIIGKSITIMPIMTTADIIFIQSILFTQNSESIVISQKKTRYKAGFFAILEYSNIIHRGKHLINAKELETS